MKTDVIAELRARVAELEADLNELREIHSATVTDGVAGFSATLQQLAAQSLTIKTMRTVLEKFIDSHEECTDFDGFTAQIVSMDDYHEAQEAIALPDNSTEVLQAWLDKQFGEPYAMVGKDILGRWHLCDKSWSDSIPLYRKPEIK